MAHINLPDGAPGIVGPMMAYPNTERHLNGLAQALLRGPSSLTEAERELIATVVSRGNECVFCANTHASTARVLFGDRATLVDEALKDPRSASLSTKMRALLVIAEKVRRDARLVDDVDISVARDAGADDQAIHDAVLIAAAFCMFNKYVDGLGTWTPHDPESYATTGQRLATRGYLDSIRS